MRLKNKVAIITGGSQGIGEAICYAYAREGAIVIVVNKNSPDLGKSVADKIKTDGGKAEAISCDVTNRAEVFSMVENIVAKYRQIDILVNNAGLAVFKSFEEHTLNDWNFMLRTNVPAAVLCSQAVIPHMKQRRYGKVIFISSNATVTGFPNLSGYTATKGALNALSKALVGELAPYGINVNTLSPGSTDTPGNSVYVNDPGIVRQLEQRNPTRKGFMQAQDIAGPAVFLASDDAKAIYGQNLVVDQGLTSTVFSSAPSKL